MADAGPAVADLHTRQLERQAAQGGVEERAAVLRRRMRAGDPSPMPCDNKTWHDARCTDPNPCPTCQGTGFRPFRVSVELAAYCGDEAARDALGGQVPFDAGNALFNLEWFDKAPLTRWAGHLDHWGKQAQVRAAVAAARAAAHKEDVEDDPTGVDWGYGGRWDAIESAEAWLKYPEGWEWGGLHPPDYDGLDWWYYLRLLLWDLRTGPQQVEQVCRFLIDGAAEYAGEQPVREAVCSALISWSLA